MCSFLNKIYGCGQTAWNAVTTCTPSASVQAIKTKISNCGVTVLDFILPKNPVHKNREIRIVPTRVENFLGKIAFSAHCPAHKIINEGEDVCKIKEVFANLVKVCDRQELAFEISLMKDDNTVNAFCVPGGKVVITTGIVEKLKENNIYSNNKLKNLSFEDKLAAVLGHEIVHACAGHGARSLQLAACMSLIGKVMSCALGIFIAKKKNVEDSKISAEEKAKKEKETQKTIQCSQNIFTKFWSLGGYLFKQKHSQAHEFESDKHGIKYAVRAGYNPQASIWLQSMFLGLKKQKEGEKSKWTDMFSSHPPSNERLEANHRLIKLINSTPKESFEKIFA